MGESVGTSSSGAGQGARNLSARRIVGFACNQAFLFFLIYQGMGEGVIGGGGFQRLGLLALLGSLVAGFALVRLLGARRIGRLFARPLLYVYAVVAAAGSLAGLFMPSGDTGALVLQGMLVGVPSALLLTAWGRAFGQASAGDSVPEVFIGSLVAALLCLLFSFTAESDLTLLATRILPLAGVVNIAVPASGDAPLPSADSAGELSVTGRMQRLSARMLLGTLLFGIACGLMDLYGAAGFEAGSFYPMGLVLFGAYLLGCLSLLLSDGFGRGAVLSKSYRLAIFVLVAGLLLVPLPQLGSSVPLGQSFVLAGYLGLETVLIALFVVMAELSATDCAMAFSMGFLALFGGEFVGLLIANGGMGLDVAGYGGPFFAAAAGIVSLLAYIFFFTERDFDTLSQMVSGLDSLERTCEQLTERYGLSARESEILAFALRGRTNERIAQELFIAKSTVDTHLRRIYAKCGVHSRQELLDLAEGR